MEKLSISEKIIVEFCKRNKNFLKYVPADLLTKELLKEIWSK